MSGDDDSSLSFRPQNKDIYLRGREGIISIYCPIAVLFFELYTRTLSHHFFSLHGVGALMRLEAYHAWRNDLVVVYNILCSGQAYPYTGS